MRWAGAKAETGPRRRVHQVRSGSCLEDGPSLESGCGGKVAAKRARVVGGVAGRRVLGVRNEPARAVTGRMAEQMLGVDQLPALRTGRRVSLPAPHSRPGETGSLPRGLNETPVRAVGSRLVPGRFETDSVIPEQVPERQGQGGLCPHTPLQTRPSRPASAWSVFRKANLRGPQCPLGPTPCGP